MVKTETMKSQSSDDANTYDPLQAQQLRELIMGFRNTLIIAEAARLNLADHLVEGPKSVTQLALITNSNEHALYRLLRALASLGIFEANMDGTFSMTSLGSLLCSKSAGTLRDVAILYSEEWLTQAYSKLSYSIENEKPAFDYVHGKPLYDYLKQHAFAAERFNKAMSAYSGQEAEAIAKAYDFSSVQSLVDIGGEQGALVETLLNAYPHLTGVVFDLPEVVNQIRHDFFSSRNNLNISYTGGDFFREIPKGGDVYLIKSVLHNWDDHACVNILKNCRNAMRSTARLLIIERVISGLNKKSEATLFDINMLVVTGGRERSEEEFKKLLESAGFRLSRIISTQSPMSIVEGVPLQ